ncbi:MAG: type II toxin-antitoxin system prevent-host-death family antitoxin [Rhodospirillaceae bacterium]|nr:type II toxin-antitoxin system prevent-host-death family antitoxin [Rhodospirillaceae bacterium]MYB13402.1 type II toxin-antitoxin system prevent-host-death family antitoxin [Rhodospirillaceae bacterium]MYI50301.1 type II toxin-antitoxin system prevent-host-death family antitoxin [Rhodospirillaceae bacterium]
MKTVNMHDAKTNLSRLVAAAVAGEPFIIARAGKPLVKVEALEQPEAPDSRLGMLKGKIQVPDDFDTMFEDEIAEMFGA